jgi:hypothetical protein
MASRGGSAVETRRMPTIVCQMTMRCLRRLRGKADVDFLNSPDLRRWPALVEAACGSCVCTDGRRVAPVTAREAPRKRRPDCP